MSTSLKCLPRAEIGREKWDAFVEASDEAWLWHRWDLIEAVAFWDGYQDASVALLDERGVIQVLMPMHRVTVRVGGVILVVRLMSLGGPACATELFASARNRAISFLRDQMDGLLAQNKAVAAEAQIAALTPRLYDASAPRINPLLLAGFDNTQTETWMVDLTRQPDEIRGRYSSTTRYELRKAARNEFRWREAAGPKDLDIYYGLHLETCARTGAAPHPLDYFRAIFEKCVPRGLARILFLERQGQVTAAQNTALYKAGALYWTGASRSDKDGGDNRLLVDAQIMVAREKGCVRYEVGQAYLNPMTAKERGLSHFKGSFGAELYPFYRGVLLSSRLGPRILWQCRGMLQNFRRTSR